MQKDVKKYIGLTIIFLLIAILFNILIFSCIYGIFKDEIKLVENMIGAMSSKSETIEKSTYLGISTDGKKLIKDYPYYGQKYADITIENVGISLPIYFGDSLEILKKGAGHMTGSYFPGEGASIIIGAHHSLDKFGKLQNVKLGDNIQITTTYGIFIYTIYDLKVIKETDFDLVPIQKEEEILMLYTCYPFGYLGYTTQRYVVYAKQSSFEVFSEVK